jgi:hypothetical protein
MVAKNVRFVTLRSLSTIFFFHCPFAKLNWRTIQFTFNIPPPTNVTNMFGNWLNEVDKNNKNNVRIGICSLMWAIWNCQNDVVFNKRTHANFLKVIRMVTHWIHEWSYLQPESRRAHMDIGCNQLEMVALAIYNQGGWRLTRRIQDS